MSNWVLEEVGHIIALQDVEQPSAEEVGPAYYQLAKRIASHKYLNDSNIGNHGIACLSDALDSAHSVEELAVLAKLYTSDSICGLLADPYAEDLSSNTQMVRGIIKVMARHTKIEKLCVFAEILGRFCDNWYVGNSPDTAHKVWSTVDSVCAICPEVEAEMKNAVKHMAWLTMSKQRPEIPDLPKLTLRQLVFGK